MAAGASRRMEQLRRCSAWPARLRPHKVLRATRDDVIRTGSLAIMKGAGVSDLVRLSEAQMRRRAPLLPSDTRGRPRVDDRRVSSGVVHVLRSCCPWRHAPREHGPPKTLDNRYLRFGDQRCVAARLRGARGCWWPGLGRCCRMRPMRRRTAAPGAEKGGARASHRAARPPDRQDPRRGT